MHFNSDVDGCEGELYQSMRVASTHRSRTEQQCTRIGGQLSGYLDPMSLDAAKESQ
jgi:hypothetical protein